MLPRPIPISGPTHAAAAAPAAALPRPAEWRWRLLRAAPANLVLMFSVRAVGAPCGAAAPPLLGAPSKWPSAARRSRVALLARPPRVSVVAAPHPVCASVRFGRRPECAAARPPSLPPPPPSPALLQPAAPDSHQPPSLSCREPRIGRRPLCPPNTFATPYAMYCKQTHAPPKLMHGCREHALTCQNVVIQAAAAYWLGGLFCVVSLVSLVVLGSGTPSLGRPSLGADCALHSTGSAGLEPLCWAYISAAQL